MPALHYCILNLWNFMRSLLSGRTVKVLPCFASLSFWRIKDSKTVTRNSTLYAYLDKIGSSLLYTLIFWSILINYIIYTHICAIIAKQFPLLTLQNVLSYLTSRFTHRKIFAFFVGQVFFPASHSSFLEPLTLQSHIIVLPWLVPYICISSPDNSHPGHGTA
jgi:hypothetical protein